ncbi:MAG: class I SAM-dependent methyltransferase [Bacteroidaceae bacterium]|nr:class I SAM-dependent methyltransferase [Bacteroidaceae bacterium]
MSKYVFKNIVSETLLIPLYMRAKESRRTDSAIIRDKFAEQLVEQIDSDYTNLDGAKLSEIGCVVRSWYFDNVVKRFIHSHKRPIVVNVGCGLDTRAQRVGDIDDVVFYEMDLPEVIKLRRKLIPETENDRYLSASLLETEWMDRLRKAHPDDDFIFVIEGVLMYFYENQVKSFLQNMAQRFPHSELWFDVCGKGARHKMLKPDSLRTHKAEIRSGFSDGHLPEKWIKNMELIEQKSYMSFFRSRWGFFFGHIMGHFPKICFKFSSLLGYKLN